MAYTIYRTLLFMPLLMARARLFKPYLTTPTTSTAAPTTVKNALGYVRADLSFTNRFRSGEIEDPTLEIEDLDVTFKTFANAIIHLNCSDVELYNDDYIEIITDDSRWVYNSTFDLHANSVLLRFRTPSGKAQFECKARANKKNRGFNVDTCCDCGRGEFHPEVWSDPRAQGLNGMGHKRPLRRPKRKANFANNGLMQMHYLLSVLLHNTTLFCGSTVISKNTALTSAFCVKDRNVSDLYYIIMGKQTQNLKNATAKLHDMKPSRIIKMIIHPEYNGSYAHNIAVVRFNTSIHDHNFAYPACLPINMYGTLDSRWFTSFGWATPQANKFNLGHVSRYTMIPLERCRAGHNFTGNATENEHSLCMIGPIIMCGIDAGGPIFYSYQNSPHVYLIGIIGEKGYCHPKKSQPKMHTNVTYYLDWVATVLKEEGQSVCVR